MHQAKGTFDIQRTPEPGADFGDGVQAMRLRFDKTFHGPLAYPVPHPPIPIFTRTRPPTVAEAEQGLGAQPDNSFYRNSFAMVRPIHLLLFE